MRPIESLTIKELMSLLDFLPANQQCAVAGIIATRGLSIPRLLNEVPAKTAQLIVRRVNEVLNPRRRSDLDRYDYPPGLTPQMCLPTCPGEAGSKPVRCMHAWFDSKLADKIGTVIYRKPDGSTVEVTEVSNHMRNKKDGEVYLGMVVHHEVGGCMGRGRPAEQDHKQL